MNEEEIEIKTENNVTVMYVCTKIDPLKNMAFMTLVFLNHSKQSKTEQAL